MKEMWQVNWKVTFASKHPALQRTKRKRTVGLIHEPFLRTNLFLSPTYEDFTKIVAFMNFFLSRIFS